MFKLLQQRLNIFSRIHREIFNPAYFSSVVPSSQTAVTPELDKLYRVIYVEVKGHDRAVLNSYEYFTKTAAAELEINVGKIWEAPDQRYRRTLLKSNVIYKKHRVQYEFRTYYRIFQLKYITGSTADTFLEYIQRNLPEGVGMKVTKHRIEKLPEHIANYVPEKDSEKVRAENESS